MGPRFLIPALSPAPEPQSWLVLSYARDTWGISVCSSLSCCPQPSTPRLLLTATSAPHACFREVLLNMLKTTGKKSLRNGIFWIIFWIFTLSSLQVLFQSRSTKKVVWCSIYLYFISTYCPGIKHFEFYIGYKKEKVSSWESALKITKDFMWDCLRSFYMLFLTVFKIPPFSLKCLCHSNEISSADWQGNWAGTTRGYTGKKALRVLDTSKVNIILVPSTHICQEVSTWPREAVSYVLVGGEAISHHTNLPEQGTPSSRSRRWL